jgi:hypothetical protein
MQPLHFGRVFLGLLLLSLAATSCGKLFPDGEDPQNARLIMDVDPGVSVTLITSTDFVVTRSEDGGVSQIELQSTDTTSVTGTFDRTYSLAPRLQFYALATGTGDGLFSVRILIDGEERYSDIREADGSPIEYRYQYYY